MNLQFLSRKGPIACLVLFLAVSFTLVEGERSLRPRRVQSHLAPRHISLSAKSGNGVYAGRYAYGRPLASYSSKGPLGKNRRNHGGGRRRNGSRENRSRTYANRYQNWHPNRGGNDPRVDRINQQKKRKELFPVLQETNFGGSKQKRRIRPHRFNPMQRPQPPKKTNDFDDEYFFPEEAKRAESKYEYENRYPRPKKKRRNPTELEQIYKKPDSGAKIPFYDEKPLGHKSKFREPSVSYSTFIQHSPGSQEEPEDFYEEDEGSVRYKPPARNKKKRVKKKSNSKKKNKDEDYYRPFSFEGDRHRDGYPPYLNADDYELPVKTNKKRNKPGHEFSQEDDFPPIKTQNAYSKPRPQASSIFSASDPGYGGGQKGADASHFSPSYSQSWSQATLLETTARPVQYQTESGFQPQYQSSGYQNRDYSSLQKTKTVTTNTQTTYYSQPDNTYKNIAYNNNYLSSQVSTSNSQTPSNYHHGYSQPSSPPHSQPSAPLYSQPASPSYSQSSSPLYSQPVSSSSSLSDITIQKSVPIYDNTETFYHYNNNAYVNGSPGRYQEPESKYGSRISSSSSSSSPHKTDSDSEFMKKHQNLYNNGLSGVPVQGDGYAKESAKKDYDIGYGDFQFDENPAS